MDSGGFLSPRCVNCIAGRKITDAWPGKMWLQAEILKKQLRCAFLDCDVPVNKRNNISLIGQLLKNVHQLTRGWTVKF